MEKYIYSKSLKAKLILERGFMIEAYQTLMDVIKSRKDAQIFSSFYKERISNGKNKVALIKGFKKNLVVYFALNPAKINEKYGISDVSNTISYANYPTKLIIDSNKDLKNAIRLMEKALSNAGLNELEATEYIDYNDELKEMTFDELVECGLIKKYIKYIPDDDFSNQESYHVVKTNNQITKVEKQPVIEMVNVRLKVMVKGIMPDDLYLITNFTNWSVDKAIKLNRVEDYFIVDAKFPKNFDLEFKISLNKDWYGVEKGIFGEEIKNHKYYLDNDIEVEDIIYNFRREDNK
ncbi:MAG: hypothetical protein IJS83_04480 [Acholeplasmatales bacterium]|nr:hypothetical protein [Acholeplasmatales bacterium]